MNRKQQQRLFVSFLKSDDDDELPKAPAEYADAPDDQRVGVDDNSEKSGTAPSTAAVDFSFHRKSSVGSLTLPSSKSLTIEEEERAASPHEVAARAAILVHRKFVENLPPSLREDYDHRDAVAPFQTGEIMLGKLLGSGEFSHVYEIRKFRPIDADLESLGFGAEEISARKLMKMREKYRDTNRASYAVKHLRPTLLEKYGVEDYAQAARDMALEAMLLNSLKDPNIIKLRGVSFAGPGGYSQGPKGYFLIIDRLNETLGDLINRWKRENKHSPTAVSTIVGNVKELVGRKWRSGSDDLNEPIGSGDKGSAAKSIIEDQLDVGLQVSSALMYLHEKGIMFRDLKPANIGVDVRGDVKLFDFGLATVMPPHGDPYEDRFVMSGAGSPRYMAPEVLVDPPDKYNFKADVYSFGIVLWEILSLETPFSHVRSKSDLVEFVVDQGGRPTINEEWKDAIKETLGRSFDVNTATRPTMQQFYNMLRLELIEIRDGDATNLSDTYIKRRRSQLSIRGIGAYNYKQQGKRHQNFPQIAKGATAIISAVKPSPSLSKGNDQGLRKSMTMLRNKFRLSAETNPEIKRNERGNENDEAGKEYEK